MFDDDYDYLARKVVKEYENHKWFNNLISKEIESSKRAHNMATRFTLKVILPILLIFFAIGFILIFVAGMFSSIGKVWIQHYDLTLSKADGSVFRTMVALIAIICSITIVIKARKVPVNPILVHVIIMFFLEIPFTNYVYQTKEMSFIYFLLINSLRAVIISLPAIIIIFVIRKFSSHI